MNFFTKDKKNQIKYYVKLKWIGEGLKVIISFIQIMLVARNGVYVFLIC